MRVRWRLRAVVAGVVEFVVGEELEGAVVSFLLGRCYGHVDVCCSESGATTLLYCSRETLESDGAKADPVIGRAFFRAKCRVV